ncbi:MAG: alpha-L-rhamnosidase N-terminal domain-containing protein [Planctomycetes bacterium]|nr:alpha-L-rhamnosidase N-terminal domain-containing protein [Planctomycetota bacterium]MBL7038855.1 alpha-L-rhamnosidase N-terminal domain-containing protein [Pirellulaceae bacterium]
MPDKRPSPCVILWLALGVLAGSELRAQQLEATRGLDLSFNPAPAPTWRAQWIWLPDNVESDMLLARKTFALHENPARAVLSITSSSRYRLLINGNYICCGPARCAPHHQSFDTLDITDALRKGKNVLAVRVHHQREGVSYYGLSRAGLLAQLDCTSGTQGSTLQTDSSWRVSPDESWQNASPRMARFHLEVCDRVDLRRKIGGWADLDFDDSKWLKARVLRREAGWPLPQPNDRPTHLIPPWTSLVPRDIPFLIETASEAQRLVHSGSIPAPEGGQDFSDDKWIDALTIARIPVSRNVGPSQGRPIVIAANGPGECRVVIYDLGEVQNGRPFLDIAAPAGTAVDIMCAPYLLEESLHSPIVASIYVDRIVLSGERERWESFYMKPARWLAVVFRHLPHKAQLFKAGLMRSEYPFEQKGYLRTPDYPELQALWDAAVETVKVCTADAYTDNYRERRQYAQTSYYACLGNYPVFGDYALQRRYLRQIAQEQLANGIMPAYAPRHGDDFMVILDSNCFWVRGLHQYLLYSGDDATARELLPAARKLLDLLHSFTNSDGLIDSPPYPYWLDHALNDRRGANFCFNGHYLGAIEDFAQVLQWLDEPGADMFRRRAARIRSALREQFWDPERKLFADAFVDGERSDRLSEPANAMALALKIAGPEQMEAVAAQLGKNESHDFIRRESGIVMVTPAMSYFLHVGLCEAGRVDASWDLLQARFAHMIAPGTNGTLWEEWWLDGTGRNGRFRQIVDGRSDAQTESAFVPALFTRYILGIEPTQPGLRDVVLRYYPSSRLPRRHGAIPTPSGLLEVAWDVSSSEFKITLGIPPGTTVRLDLASLAAPAEDRISIDDQPPSANQLKDGFLVISSGDHTLRVKR